MMAPTTMPHGSASSSTSTSTTLKSASSTSSTTLPMPSQLPANVPVAQPTAAQFHLPRAIGEPAGELADKITRMDIARINGYLRLANLLGAGILVLASFVALTRLENYEQLLVYVCIMVLGAGLVVCENHESFPALAENIKKNFGFMFTAPGRSCYVLVIALLAFSLGWIGIIVGFLFLALALFNFFLIHKHPAYQSHMTNTESCDTAQRVPEVRYNPNQPSTTSATSAGHIMV
uniref:Uncharacterized protein AlNc14C1362G12909 n=1 Tax=Albugo laibachii Nc14 TaxID=890382 RepID=F0X2P1_9STRA|nr:conserved hypothetical protein [Albugo laibachii Nc14]|eukprot:CCA28162.1 conserved hypothetical protein [Albugo laibachii Nc14]